MADEEKNRYLEKMVECARCSVCCREPLVPVTDSDVKRLINHTKLPARKIVRFFSPSEMNYDPDADLWIRFRYGKRAMVLRKERNGKCIFLSPENKCSVYSARPFTCRSFPYDIEFESVKSLRIDSFEFIKIVNCKAKPSRIKLLPELLKTVKQEQQEDRRYHSLIKKWNRLEAPGGTINFLSFAGLE
ncbi:hypothetical protein CHISP_1031 [Chitinispirillum alkaliphilum]|nr:hypothetical protein CHISP_1031 [Chitinispirillum alkaliphilum]